MKTRFAALFLVGLASAVLVPACMDAQTAKNVESDVFTTTQLLCILNNASLQNADVAKACSIADALIPSLQQVLAAHRKGVGVPKAAGCP